MGFDCPAEIDDGVRIIKYISKGGQGSVYEGEFLHEGRYISVAIKIAFISSSSYTLVKEFNT